MAYNTWRDFDINALRLNATPVRARIIGLPKYITHNRLPGHDTSLVRVLYGGTQ